MCFIAAHSRCVLYANDRMSTYDDRHLLKSVDDTVLISLLWAGGVNQAPAVNDFVEWCDQHFRKINIKKTKEMVIDFQIKAPTQPLLLNLNCSLFAVKRVIK